MVVTSYVSFNHITEVLLFCSKWDKICTLQLLFLRTQHVNIFSWNNLNLLGFALPCFVIGLENTRYPLNQSGVKLKPMAPWLRAFSRTSGRLLVFSLSYPLWYLPSLWLVVGFTLVVVGNTLLKSPQAWESGILRRGWWKFGSFTTRTQPTRTDGIIPRLFSWTATMPKIKVCLLV